MLPADRRMKDHSAFKVDSSGGPFGRSHLSQARKNRVAPSQDIADNHNEVAHFQPLHIFPNKRGTQFNHYQSLPNRRSC
jgi:hypothetical protein